MRAGWRGWRARGLGGVRKLWHGWAIEVLSRNTKVGLVCRELKEGAWKHGCSGDLLSHWSCWIKVIMKLEYTQRSCWMLVYRDQKHLRPELHYTHVPRELSWAWLILHQWESHRSNQVPAASLGGWREQGDGEKQRAYRTSHLPNLNSTKGPVSSLN